MEKVKIHIGEIFVSREPAMVQTLLGSCVSVCLFDRLNRIGGMNHILLPGRSDLATFDGSARYGINAMELLINELMKMGAAKRHIIAKVFGGAHIIQVMERETSPGTRNVAFVREFLQMEQIPLASVDVGGDNPRRILFHTDTGDVFVKTLPALFLGRRVTRQEEDYRRQLDAMISAPDKVDIFR